MVKIVMIVKKIKIAINQLSLKLKYAPKALNAIPIPILPATKAGVKSSRINNPTAITAKIMYVSIGFKNFYLQMQF
jgi:hypothetical protein